MEEIIHLILNQNCFLDSKGNLEILLPLEYNFETIKEVYLEIMDKEVINHNGI